MKLKTVIPISIALIVLAEQCNKDENKVFASGNNSGTVTSKDDGSPIVVAKVTTNPISSFGITQTGNTKNYSLDLDGGKYTLIITKENYLDFDKQNTIDGIQLVENLQMEETPLTAWTYKFDCKVNYSFELIWSEYTTQGTCKNENGAIMIQSSVTTALGPNDHLTRTIIIKIDLPISIGTFDLISDTTNNILYMKKASYNPEADLYST